ncbi:MAG: universal stress protein [Geobacter sp.]|jgi:nucleotide-binding universal stress UspA family protein|uniref:universal stress protein n=1 Tax=Trichlorobacter sp. TaxID=2911007 RepID=UPI002A36EA7B|nr:universal stress protein [Trichlorobacter sp.]MDY0383832.1 universal stress protein [Trichlorobacter sp.]
MKPFTKILVATDFSDCSVEACAYALTLARKFDASLQIVHVINEPVDLRGFYVPHISFDQLEKEIADGAVSMLDSFCKENLPDFSNFTTTVVSGVPYEEITRTAQEQDASLIVIGTHGRSGLDHLIFGSTAERVVRSAPCPVLTIRLASSN